MGADGIDDKSASQQINFGKKLAHTDKAVRDKGFLTLKSWLQEHTELDRLEYMKLWKGLYFGMWMADKRPVQQDLAVKVAMLLNEVPRPKQGMWLDTFWETMQAAWEKLDKHRMSKYLLFVRIVVAEAFKALRLGGWDLAELRAASDTFTRGVPRHARQGLNAPSSGLLLQFSRVLWDELKPQLEEEPKAPQEALMTLLEPFCLLAEGSALDSLVRNIHEHILRKVPKELSAAMAARILSGAASTNISKKNREALYETADMLERGSGGKPGKPSQGATDEKAATDATGKGRRKRKRGKAEVGGSQDQESNGSIQVSPLMLPKAALHLSAGASRRRRRHAAVAAASLAGGAKADQVAHAAGETGTKASVDKASKPDRKVKKTVKVTKAAPKSKKKGSTKTMKSGTAGKATPR